MGIRRALLLLAIAAVPLLAPALGERQAGAETAAAQRSARKARLLEAQRHGGSSASRSSRSFATGALAPGDCGDGTIEPPETCDPPGLPAGSPRECRDNCTFCGDGRLDTSAELLTNGDFELGTLTGWTVTNLAGSTGTWVIDVPGTSAPTSGLATAPNPVGGSSCALTDMGGPGTHALVQSFTVPEAARAAELRFQMFVDSWSAPGAVHPGGLDHALVPNQHARVDLLTAGSPPFTTGVEVLASFYLGVDAGASPHAYTDYMIDITPYTDPGVTYELRFAGVENQFFLHVGVDNVRVTALLETCDDGNNNNGDGCTNICRLECGNGTIQPVEECDDWNTTSGDGCSDLCLHEASEPIACGFVSTGTKIEREGADVDTYILTAPPGTPVGIDVDAELLGSMLDGMLGVFTSGGTPLGVSDDDPAPLEPGSLDPYLLVTVPADGILDIRVTAFNDLDFDGGEDHLGAGPYTLEVTCSPIVCGDEIIETPETCDPPGVPPGPGVCRADCTSCGDGVLHAPLEECDDDNNASSDGCSDACALEFCGDGLIQPGLGETCEPGVTAVAIFQDENPWGSTSIQSILTANGVPFTIYTSADIGVVSLALYDKVLIASAQPPAFYAAVSANATWFDAYVAGGGALEFHGAAFYENDWSALPMPAGLTIAPQDPNTADDALTIVAPGNWLMSVPNPIAPAQVDGWGFSTHGYFTGAGWPFTTIVQEDEFQQPVLIEMDAGAGCVIATMMTVEWFGADPDVLENLLLRHCASDCRDNCTRCGDGVHQPAFEGCDDGNNISGDGCTSTCLAELHFCGDFVLDENEECDPPAPIPGGSTCCAAHAPPGCTDFICQDLVCAVDPACCSGPWSAACAALAQTIPDCVAGCTSTASCTQACCFDTDGDQICDTADSCPLSPNPGGGAARFDRTIHAIDSGTFAWFGARNVDWVQGNIAGIAGYVIAGGVSSAAGAQTIPAPPMPPIDEIYYLIVKPDCDPSSWSTGSPSECAEPGVCPPGGRDGSLPLP